MRKLTGIIIAALVVTGCSSSPKVATIETEMLPMGNILTPDTATTGPVDVSALPTSTAARTDIPTTALTCGVNEHEINLNDVSSCQPNIDPPPSTDSTGAATPSIKVPSGHHSLGIRFSLITSGSSINGPETVCSGSGGYSDFQAGMNVTVHDGNGKIIGAGQLDNDPNSHLAHPNVECDLIGAIDIRDADFYVVTIGKRGDQTYAKADMAKRGYSMELTLGS
jgi:hypothetical protein